MNRKASLELNISQKGLILVAVPLVCELIFVAILFYLLEQAEREGRIVARSRAIVAASNDVRKTGFQEGMSLLMFAMSKSAHARSVVEKNGEEAQKALTQLRLLLEDDPVQMKHFRDLEKSAEFLRASREQILNLFSDGKSPQNYADLYVLRRKSEKESMKTNVALDNICKYETEKGHTEKTEEEIKSLLKAVLLGGVGLNIVVAVALALYFNKHAVSRLTVLLNNSMRLSQGLPLAPHVSGTDEIAALDAVFHEMAGALSAAARVERAVLDNAVDVICALDSENKFERVNQAAATAWGYDPDELIGKRMISLLVPEEVDATLEALSRLRKAEVSSFECSILTKSGNQIITLWNAQWSEPEKLLFCVAHDVTDRRMAEKRVRALIDDLPLGLLVVDRDGQIATANPRAEEMFKCSQAELKGSNIKEMFTPVLSDGAAIDFDTLLEAGLGRSREYTVGIRGGQALSVDVCLNQLSQQEPPQYVVSLLDATERHQIERLKQEFVAMISHDLRTPLAAIQATLGLAQSGIYGDVSDPGKKRLLAAERNCERLISLISDLIQLEKMQAGKLDLDLSVCEVPKLIERSIESVQGFAEKCGIRLEADACEAQIMADSRRFIQVIVNLLSNAIKFSNPGGEVRVTATIIHGGNLLEFGVIDNGRGIPKDHLSSIFDRFSQVRPSDAAERQGSGLGLTICKSIVEAHGGAIGVDSEEGKGSRFWIRMKLHGAHAQEGTQLARQES